MARNSSRRARNYDADQTAEFGALPANSRFLYDATPPKAKRGQKAPNQPVKPHMIKVTARTTGQQFLREALEEYRLLIATGPAGTGKTMWATERGLRLFLTNQVERLILTRPAQEAGESLGFMPGGLRDKMDPYLRPLWDTLEDLMGGPSARKFIEDWVAEGRVEIAPIGFLRGRTLKNAFVICDEAQNCSYPQLKLILTRLGENATMVLTGDPNQSDLPEGKSGYAKLIDIFKRNPSPNRAVIELHEADIVRDPLVKELIAILP